MKRSLMTLAVAALCATAGLAHAAAPTATFVKVNSSTSTGPDAKMSDGRMQELVLNGLRAAGVQPKTVGPEYKGRYWSVNVNWAYVGQLKDLRMAATSVELREDDGQRDVALCGSTSLTWTSPASDRFASSLQDAVAGIVRRCAAS